MESDGTASAEKIVPVKTVETHSFLLLTHNFLPIKTGKFYQPLYNKGNCFDLD